MTREAKEYRDFLEKYIAQSPEHAEAHNKLGVVFFGLKNWSAALDKFQTAIALQPSYFEAWYNLGLVYMRQEAITQAIATWQKLLTFSPEQSAVLFQLARCYMLQEQFSLAEKILVRILEIQPDHLESQCNLALCYLKQGAFALACTHYLLALKAAPNDPDILFNLGVIAEAQQDADLAIRRYQQVLQISPDFFAAHYNLAVIFIQKKHIEFALDHLYAALRLQSDNQNIKYLIEMLEKNKNIQGAPKEYIQTLFDAYADHYEMHLTQALEYCLPDIFYAAVKKIIKFQPHSLVILDVGCGTGLCSVPFKPWAKVLEGVDLSEKMLDVAREKNIFDHLTCADIVTYLRARCDIYDLILSGDVLVYAGDLADIFETAHAALRSGGLFVFNTEVSQMKDFMMQQSGRFAHSETYLKHFAKINGFSIVSFEMKTSRLQNNQPVLNYVCAFQKTI